MQLELMMRCLCLVNDLMHMPVVEYVASFIFWATQLLLGPLYLVLYLLLGIVDLVSGYVWWRYEKADPSKPIVVTGCDTGFGHSLALTLTKRGWKVYACCLTKQGMASLEEQSKGGLLVTMKLDVTSEDDIQALGLQLQHECPHGIYALVNNAGIAISGDADWLPMSTFRKAMEVNFFGAVAVIKECLPLLKAYGKGARVVNTCTMAGLFYGAPGMSSYAASKHALEAFSSSLRSELHHWGIKVCVVNPTFHRTPMPDLVPGQMRNTFHSLPKHKQGEYGPAYLEACIRVAKQLVACQWDPQNVVNALVHATVGTIPRGHYIVGLDAKFVYAPGLLLPMRVVDWLTTHVFLYGNFTPARLTKTAKLKAQ